MKWTGYEIRDNRLHLTWRRLNACYSTGKIVSPAPPRSPVLTAQKWSLSAPTNTLVSGWTTHFLSSFTSITCKPKVRPDWGSFTVIRLLSHTLPNILWWRWPYSLCLIMVMSSIKWLPSVPLIGWMLSTTQPSVLPPFSTHHCDLYKLIGWPSLHTRRLHHWFLLIYKTLLGKTPWYLSNLLHLSHNNYHLRSSEFFTPSIPKARTVFGQNSFRFAAANDWNSLQNSLKLPALPSLHIFKQKLQHSLVGCCVCWFPCCSFSTCSILAVIYVVFNFIVFSSLVVCLGFMCTVSFDLFLLRFVFFTSAGASCQVIIVNKIK